MERVYLDYAATTPTRLEVIEEVSSTMNSYWANPSSQYKRGREAKAKLEASRKKIADLLAIDKDGIIFTSGATEANNLLIKANAYRLKAAGKGTHLITGKAEHASVYETFKDLEKKGFTVTYLDLDENGAYSVEDLKANLSDDTSLVSLMTVNNETGVIMPIKEISKLLKEKDIFFHTDCVQGIGKMDTSFLASCVDAFSMSAHKIYGPKGIGVAYQDPKIGLKGLNLGGHQEADRRAGTESVALAAGLAKALELIEAHKTEYLEKIQALVSYFYEQLDAVHIDYEINGHGDKYPGIQNVWFKGQDASQALIKLDLNGVEVSAGSACAAGSLEKSRVLESMFKEGPRLDESLRISFGIFTEKADVDKFVKTIKVIIDA